MSAQKQTEGKSSVFIDYFAHPSNVKDSWAEALRSKVIEGIQETNRVLITDVDAEDALRVEKARRQNGELSAAGDASRLAVMTPRCKLSVAGHNHIIVCRPQAF